MKVSIVSWEKFNWRPFGSIGSSMIRARWLAEKWDEASEWKHGDKFDAIILQKCYWMDMVKDFQGVKILDMCDPDWMRGQDTSCRLVEISQYIDAITCSTDALTNVIKGIIKHIPVITIPDRINMDYFTVPKKHTEVAKSAVWFGYFHKANQLLNHVMPSLKKRNLSLYVVSNSEFIPDNDYGVEISNIMWTPNNAFMDIQSGDFVINPGSPFGDPRFKSNNKTLIAKALGMPVANTAEDMDRFIDPKEREKESIKGLEEVKKYWDISRSIQQYKDLIVEIQKNKA
jgi:hypothetical protein